MRTIINAMFFLLVVLAAGNAVAQAPLQETHNAQEKQNAASPPLWKTRQTTFGIPFSINTSLAAPREVQLFVSADRGGSWRIYAREKPTARRFNFRAPRDGEYWFAVRTLPSQGQADNDTPRQAEVRVVVDTKPPRVDFYAEVGSAGEVVTTWKVDDDHLQPQSLKVEYQAAYGQPWQPLAVKNSPDQSQRTVSGKMSWWPKTSSRVVHVRASVRDTAGNVASVNRRVFLPQVDQPPRGISTINNTPSQIPKDSFVANNNPGVRRGTPWPADKQSYQLPGRQGQLADVGTPRNDPHPLEPPVDGQFVGHRPKQHDEPANVLPPGIKPRITRRKRFDLSYRVEETDRRDLTSVELWATRDGGRTWTRHSTDTDLQSPCTVEVTEDGAYGFRIVLAGQSGQLGAAPRPGDVADIWVVIDSASPTARLTSAIFGSGTQAGKLDIRWKADDPHLIQQPVTLMYSASPDGPWTTIAADLPNTGQFLWQVGSNVPQQVYLGLSVLDTAGNEGADRLREPVRLQGLAPKGRILDILPPDSPPPRGAFRPPTYR